MSRPLPSSLLRQVAGIVLVAAGLVVMARSGLGAIEPNVSGLLVGVALGVLGDRIAGPCGSGPGGSPAPMAKVIPLRREQVQADTDRAA